MLPTSEKIAKMTCMMFIFVCSKIWEIRLASEKTVLPSEATSCRDDSLPNTFPNYLTQRYSIQVKLIATFVIHYFLLLFK